MRTKQKESKRQESPWSFRPDEDVRKLVVDAIAATGMDRSELVNRAIRTCAAKAVDEVFAESRKKEALWIAARAEASSGHSGDVAAGLAARAAVALSARPEAAEPIETKAKPFFDARKRKDGQR